MYRGDGMDDAFHIQAFPTFPSISSMHMCIFFFWAKLSHERTTENGLMFESAFLNESNRNFFTESCVINLDLDELCRQILKGFFVHLHLSACM